jgi:hypothetical protein
MISTPVAFQRTDRQHREDAVTRRNTWTRRDVVLGALGLAAATPSLFAGQVYKDIRDLQPGEFTWHPERSPLGAVAIVVSIPDQRVHVYRNGIRIGVSTCSTGKPGHETPTGVFTILQKDKDHRSSTYNNAPMPNMNRLTWDGVALHAGKLPGYPASHGCVRLPLEFSELLFGVTHVGTAVIVAGAHADPSEVVHPGLVLADYAEDEFEAAVANLKGKEIPTEEQVATSIVVSSADSSLTVLENGRVVAAGAARIRDRIEGERLGEHVYILHDTHDARRGLVWHAIGYQAESGADVDRPDEATLRRLSADQALLEVLHARLHPGTVLVLTDLPLHPSMRSGEDFVIMTAA